ncbi:hypothetical protein, partial [Mahella sp.]|uniref:hypothetical protein n=1 Tax=Mahella sp. TaxID=2798721 RepID=UPI0025BBF51E
ATAVKLDHYAIKDCCGPTLQKPAQHICQALHHLMMAYLQFVSLEQANAIFQGVLRLYIICILYATRFSHIARIEVIWQSVLQKSLSYRKIK